MTPAISPVPDIVGATVFTGAAVTAAVVTDHMVTEPVVFVSVTANEMNRAASAVTGVYVVVVAPEMAEQVLGWVEVAVATAAVQEYQFWVAVAAGVAVQVPMAPVSAEPTLAVPVIVGGAELTGKAVTPGEALTAAVEMDHRVRDPEVLVWVTAKEMNFETCEAVGVKVRPVEPAIALQAAGLAETAAETLEVHEYQACVTVAAGVEVQVPLLPVNTEPT